MTAKSKDIKEFSGKQTNIKITSSQLEFFRMLDEKIEQVILILFSFSSHGSYQFNTTGQNLQTTFR